MIMVNECWPLHFYLFGFKNESHLHSPKYVCPPLEEVGIPRLTWLSGKVHDFCCLTMIQVQIVSHPDQATTAHSSTIDLGLGIRKLSFFSFAEAPFSEIVHGILVPHVTFAFISTSEPSIGTSLHETADNLFVAASSPSIKLSHLSCIRSFYQKSSWGRKYITESS